MSYLISFVKGGRMVSLNKYKNQRRIYPKLRISWSLYKAWVRGDYLRVWQYLTETEHYKTAAMTKGKQTHEYIEDKGLPNKVQKIISDKESWIIDYKTGSLSGYEKQLNFYCWLVKNKLEQYEDTLKKKKKLHEIYIEKKIEFSEKEFIVVGIPDVLVIRKENILPKCGLLVQIEPDYDKNNEIVSIKVKKTAQYELSEKWLEDWEMILDTMYQDIMLQIEEGHLDDFIKYELSEKWYVMGT